MAETEEIARLFADWVSASFTINSEFGSSSEWPSMIERFKLRAAELGLVWSNDFVPEHIWSLMADWEEL